MSSIWGSSIKVSIFGESHGKGIGVVIDGLPSGEEIDLDEVMVQMARRAPGTDRFSTKRKENDYPNVLSGFIGGHTTGTPLCAVIENTDANSSDYDAQAVSTIRPGHADFTGNIRYHGFQDPRGGGHFSGRLTAPLTFAGAVCRQILKRRGIEIYAHIYSIGSVKDTPFDPLELSNELKKRLSGQLFPVIRAESEYAMRSEIDFARRMQDSIGGIVECAILGLPPGIGSPIFGGIENVISSIIFGIPAIKGIEFGAGFAVATMRGSQNNDSFTCVDGVIKTTTNNHGGILGGISSGMPILFKTAIKPTPSIAMQQKTVNITTNENTTLSVRGRHDPCIVPRAVPVIEAAAAIAILDLMAEVNQL